MSLVIFDRVRETTVVTGTSDAVLLGAVTGFQAFSVVGNGNTTYYTISDQAGVNWETGLGTYSTSGPTLERTTVLSSSNAGNKVSFPAGTKDVFLTYPSEKAVYLDGSDNVQPNLGAASFTSISDSGNLTFTGTGNRITGDFSNGTIASRVYFQNSVVNTGSNVGILPNGTAGGSFINTFGNSDPTNAAFGQFGLTGNAEVTIRSSITGTGTFLPLTIYTGGSERLRIDTSGNVGIGTSSPAYKLDVNGLGRYKFISGTGAGTWLDTTGNASRYFVGTDAATESWRIYDSVAATQRILLDSAGNVGIGTASPTTKLDVRTAAGTAVQQNIYTGSNAASASLQFGQVGAVSWDAGITATSGNFLIGGLGGTIPEAYRINRNGSTIDYQTWSTGATNTERMRIDSAGNVGIGTTPSAWTSALKAIQVIGASIFNNNNSTGFASNVYRTGGGYTPTYYSNAPAGEFGYNLDGTYAWSFHNAISGTAGTTATLTERMRIDSAGNVGIGTSAPNVLLNTYAATNALSIQQVVQNANGGSGVAAFGFDVSFVPTEGRNIKAGIGLERGTSFGGGGLCFYNNNSGAAGNFTTTDEKMRITSDGNLAIGSTTTGGYKLLVRPADLGNTAGDTSLAYRAVIATNNQDAFEVLWRRRVSTPGWPFADLLIRRSVDNTAVQSTLTLGGAGGGTFQFDTAGVERMRIDGSGNVGIGTSSPLNFGGTNLQVENSTIGSIVWSNGTFVGQLLASASAEVSIGSRSNHPLRLGTNDTERMRIDSAGNVGIGTSSPAQRLHVSSSVSGAQLQLTYPSIRNYTIGVTSDFALAFRDADAAAERMRIHASGGVSIGNTTDSGAASLNVSGSISGGYVALANGTTAMPFGVDNVVRVTPTATATFTSTVPAAGAICVLSILTSGTSSYTITFGTGFKTTGTLATGTTSARYFQITFVSDGTNLLEMSRTTAIT